MTLTFALFHTYSRTTIKL